MLKDRVDNQQFWKAINAHHITVSHRWIWFGENNAPILVVLLPALCYQWWHISGSQSRRCRINSSIQFCSRFSVLILRRCNSENRLLSDSSAEARLCRINTGSVEESGGIGRNHPLWHPLFSIDDDNNYNSTGLRGPHCLLSSATWDAWSARSVFGIPMRDAWHKVETFFY